MARNLRMRALARLGAVSVALGALASILLFLVALQAPCSGCQHRVRQGPNDLAEPAIVSGPSGLTSLANDRVDRSPSLTSHLRTTGMGAAWGTALLAAALVWRRRRTMPALLALARVWSRRGPPCHAG